MLCMVVGVGSAWAEDPEVTLDFTSQSNWDIPTSGKNNTSLATFTNGTYSIKLYATTNYKLNSGYLILGKKDSYLELPAFDFDVEKIEVEGASNASESVLQNIYVGSTAVSTETKGAKNVTNSYEINSNYQAAGNVYQLKVTSDHNTQISYIRIYKKAAASETTTSVTIDDSGIDNTDVYTSTSAGSLAATVNDNAGQAISGASVTWSSSDEGVATIAANGAVTLVAAGTTTITATYAGVSGTHDPSSATYELTVTNSDPNQPGTVNNPYTVTAALAAQPANGVYVQGTISAITEVSTQYKNATYTISDGTNEMLIYRGRYLDDADFTSADQIQLGDVVKVYGNLAVHNNANQMAQGNYIVNLDRKTLSSITLSGTYATSFVEGSEFNHDGVVVTATYSDQTTADVTSQAEFSTPDMTQVGEQTVTVSYGGQSTSYNITITEAPTHTATFSVNGTTSTEDFKEGAAITFPSVTAPTGYTFMGWTETAISTTQETAPGDLTSSATMGNADITYYAVFAVGTGSGEDTYEQLTSQSFDANATYVIAGKQSSTVNTMYYLQSYDNTDVDVAWGVATTTPATATPVQFTLSGTASALVAQDNSGNYLTCFSAKKFAMSSTSTTVYLDEDGAIKSASDGNLLRYNYNTGNGGFRWYAGTTGTQAYFYKVIPGTTYSDYCTTIPTTVAITITAARAASFSTTFPLDFTGVEGITAYAATLKTDKYVHLEAVTTVPAGEGIIVKGAEGTYDVPIAPVQ